MKLLVAFSTIASCGDIPAGGRVRIGGSGDIGVSQTGIL